MQHMKNQKTPQRSSSQSAGHRKPRFKTPPAPQRQQAPQKRGGKPIVWIALIFILVAVGFFAYPYVKDALFESQTKIGAQDEVKVSIAEGSSAPQIAEKLYEAKLISSKSEFISEVKTQDAAAKLKPGVYVLNGGLSVPELVKILSEGPGAYGIKLAIPEGFTVKKVAARVSEVYGIAPEEFLSQAKASRFVGEYPFLKEAHDDSLEGFLYPKTYVLNAVNPTADDIIRAMLSQYQKEVESLDFAEAQARIKSEYNVDMTQYDFIIMASIIERETNAPDQQAKVSSTFYNRLKIDMPLQSDATMLYVTETNVTAEDLKTQSPYNSYLNKGLTPTPICSPSISCIKAAMNPDKTNYLYFFINEKVVQFSETYEQHNEAIQKATRG